MEEKYNKNEQKENCCENLEYIPYINVGTKENPVWIPLF